MGGQHDKTHSPFSKAVTTTQPAVGNGLRVSRRTILAGSLGFASSALALSMPIVAAAAAEKAGGQVTWAQNRFPLTFNPLNPIGGMERWVWQLTSSRLVNKDTKGNIIPDFAKTYTVSQDGLVYTFNLVRTAKWSDGKPVTARDVEFTYTYAADKRTGSRYPELLASVKGVNEYLGGSAKSISGIKVLDDFTVQFELSQPDAPFLPTMAGLFGPYLVPAHLLDSIPPGQFDKCDYNTKVAGRVGMGPYLLAETQKDQDVVFTRNDTYFKGKPLIDKFIFRVMQPDVALAALLKGEIDISSVPGTQLTNMKKQGNIRIETYPSYLWDGLEFNMTKPYFKDLRIRQAVAHAIDRQAYCTKILGGLGEPWESIYVQKEFVASNLVHYDYNPGKARDLLKAAGWDSSRTVEWKYYGESFSTLAPILQQNLAAVGFKIKPLLLETATWVDEVVTKGDFEFSVIGGNGVLSDPSELARFFACDTWTRYCNQQMLKLFATGQRQTNPEERKQTYDTIQETVNHDLPCVVLWAIDEAVGFTKRVNAVAYDHWSYLFFEKWSVTD